MSNLPNPEKSKKTTSILISVLITVIVIGGGAYWWYTSSDRDSSNSDNNNSNQIPRGFAYDPVLTPRTTNTNEDSGIDELYETLDEVGNLLVYIRDYKEEGKYIIIESEKIFPNSGYYLSCGKSLDNNTISWSIGDVYISKGFATESPVPVKCGYRIDTLTDGKYEILLNREDKYEIEINGDDVTLSKIASSFTSLRD